MTTIQLIWSFFWISTGSLLLSFCAYDPIKGEFDWNYLFAVITPFFCLSTIWALLIYLCN